MHRVARIVLCRVISILSALAPTAMHDHGHGHAPLSSANLPSCMIMTIATVLGHATGSDNTSTACSCCRA